MTARFAGNARRSSPGLALGVVAAVTSAAIWGTALTMTRLGVSGAAIFGPSDIGMMRFLVPAVVLLPILWRARARLLRTNPLLLMLMLTGGGMPFVLVAGTGLQSSATAEAGALLPGTIPLCVVGLSTALGEPLGRQRAFGLGLITVAVTVIAGPAILAGDTTAWGGHALLLVAAMLSAGYTIALRKAALGALEAAAFVSGGSTVVFGPVYLLTMKPRIFAVPVSDLLVQAAYQGMIPGLLAPVALAVAVARLGASGAAAFGGLSPAAATLFGGLLLAETPNAATLLGVIVAGVGAVLVSGIMRDAGIAPPWRHRISAGITGRPPATAAQPGKLEMLR